MCREICQGGTRVRVLRGGKVEATRGRVNTLRFNLSSRRTFFMFEELIDVAKMYRCCRHVAERVGLHGIELRLQ